MRLRAVQCKCMYEVCSMSRSQLATLLCFADEAQRVDERGCLASWDAVATASKCCNKEELAMAK